MTAPKNRVRYGMIGGGEGAFIGAIHRLAAAVDGNWELVCGALSSDQGRNARSGAALGLDASRTYGSFEAMLAGELALPGELRMQVAVVVTPNHLHTPMAVAALDAGFHVMCEKPMALSLDEAFEVEAAIARNRGLYCLAFTYSGYPLIEEARLRVARGDFGNVRLVQVEYSQGWLSQPIDIAGNKQAEWRTDPARAGLGGCLGDIGTHAFHLAEHVSGLEVDALTGELATHVEGRRLDDDVAALLRFKGGARGVLKASQIAAGDENGLRLRVHGEHGGLDWSQMEPNSLTLRWHNRPTEILRASGPGLQPTTLAMFRTPAGHPEGYIEAFANLYRAFGGRIATSRPNPSRGEKEWFPPVADGIRTMAFVEAMIANAAGTKKWTRLDDILSVRQP